MSVATVAPARARIICIGNPLAEADDAGPAVHARLAREALPAGVELVEGALRGLDLVGLVEGSERVAFVDSVSGWAEPGEVVVLDGADLEAVEPVRYGHAAGFAYLLRALPHLLGRPVPLRVIGLEAPVRPAAVERAAALAVAWACSGSEEGGR